MQASLPIDNHAQIIVDTLTWHQVVVIVGETGSGKSTRVPIILLEAGFCDRGIMGVTEPRRICATSLATYVSEQFGTELGETIGYHIRHENRTEPDVTRIKFMTEGVLIRELLSDPLLARYDVIVLDEVHERGLNQDLLMAMVKDILPQRPDLKVVVMSATINQKKFSDFFGGAPVINVEGRAYPVEVQYLEPPYAETIEEDVVNGCLKLLADTSGDVLAFVSDYETIRRVLELLEGHPTVVEQDLAVLTLYGNQAPSEQLDVVYGRTRRSIIISTNVAETSVTLDGLTGIVDTGLRKEMSFDPASCTYALTEVEHSRAGLDQRKGRCGRTGPGTCLRLFSEKNYEQRKPFAKPEILRSNLDQTYLQMRVMGYGEEHIREFGFMDRPHPDFWTSARECLTIIKALDDDGTITEEGFRIAEIPLSPTEAKMVFAAKKHGCVRRVVRIAATFATRQLFLRPPGKEDQADEAQKTFRNQKSDMLTALDVIDRWHAAKDKEAFVKKHFLHPLALREIDAAEEQILAIVDNFGIELSRGDDADSIGKSVLAGLAANLLERVDTDEGPGKSFKGRFCNGVYVFPGSSLRGAKEMPVHAVASKIVQTSRLFAQNMQAVPTRWLSDVFEDCGDPRRKTKPDKAAARAASKATSRKRKAG